MIPQVGFFFSDTPRIPYRYEEQAPRCIAAVVTRTESGECEARGVVDGAHTSVDARASDKKKVQEEVGLASKIATTPHAISSPGAGVWQARSPRVSEEPPCAQPYGAKVPQVCSPRATEEPPFVALSDGGNAAQVRSLSVGEDLPFVQPHDGHILRERSRCSAEDIPSAVQSHGEISLGDQSPRVAHETPRALQPHGGNALREQSPRGAHETSYSVQPHCGNTLIPSVDAAVRLQRADQNTGKEATTQTSIDFGREARPVAWQSPQPCEERYPWMRVENILRQLPPLPVQTPSPPAEDAVLKTYLLFRQQQALLAR